MNFRFLYLLIVLAFTFPTQPLVGQHMHETGHEMADSTHEMTHAFSLSLPMNRNSSGTGWMPDETPMYAWMKHGKKWNYMVHGALYLRYSMQNLSNDYKRGGHEFNAPNWLMGMAQRQVGNNGLLLLRTMISLDRITMGGDGYPLLFQSGETWKNSPLVDRQHPHDLISELAVGYTHRINTDIDASVYVGYPGEPALGPAAFMHRISSLNNPDAPLGHHWQDATHITFGVATLGLRYKILKVEVSSFTGREPGENRYNFDEPKFDSYSYRLSVNPSKNLSFQISHAKIKSPEILEPDVNVRRTTASALHSFVFDNGEIWVSSLIWGFNNSGGHHQEHSLLFENNYQNKRWTLYSRYEWVQKFGEELSIVEHAEKRFDIGAISLGVNFELTPHQKVNTAVGVQSTLNLMGETLKEAYGNTPFSAQAYIRFIPALMKMNSQQRHH